MLSKYDELLIKAGLDKERAPPILVVNQAGSLPNAYYRENRATNTHYIGFAANYLERLSSDEFEAIAAHELGHVNNTIPNRESVEFGIDMVETVMNGSKKAVIPIVIGGLLLQNSAILIAGVSVLAASTALYSAGKLITRYINHNSEYKADKYAGELIGFHQKVKMFLQDELPENLQNEIVTDPSSMVDKLTDQRTFWQDLLFGQDTHPTTANRVRKLLEQEDISWTDKLSKDKESEHSRTKK